MQHRYTHRFSNCFNFDIENGISPFNSLNDKSLYKQKKTNSNKDDYQLTAQQSTGTNNKFYIAFN